MDGRSRKDIQIGQTVTIVQKQDQRTGKLTKGVVERILTKSLTHPHSIKRMAEAGKSANSSSKAIVVVRILSFRVCIL